MLKLAITSLVLVVAIPNLALADPKRDQARTLLREGNRLHDAGNYAGALERFRRARELFPSYKIDLNIAGTLDKMGHKADAAGAFERFVGSAPDDAPSAIVAGARKRLEALKPLVASVSVTSNVDGATVVLDGKARGSTPTSERLYLEPGAHQLEVRLEGYTTYGAQLKLARGDHRDLTVELRQAAQAPPPAKHDDGGRGTKTLWAYITLGTGAALAVTAAVLYGVGKSQGDKAHDEYAATRDQTEMDRHWKDVESAETKILVGHVLVGTAAAALGVSAYMFLTRPEERAGEQPSTSVTLLPGRGGGALVVEGRF